MSKLFKMYFNTYVKNGKRLPNVREVTSQFSNYYSDVLDKEIMSKKTKTTKNKYLKMKIDGLNFIQKISNLFI